MADPLTIFNASNVRPRLTMNRKSSSRLGDPVLAPELAEARCAGCIAKPHLKNLFLGQFGPAVSFPVFRTVFAKLLLSPAVAPGRFTALIARNLLSRLGVMLFAKADASLRFAAHLARPYKTMQLAMMPSIGQLNIFDRVVCPILVFVVNQLARFQRAAKVLAHDKPVFQDVTRSLRIGMCWQEQKDISLFNQPSGAFGHLL
jgi:hypothetical protein